MPAAWFGLFAKIHGGDLLERRNQRAQGFEILVAGEQAGAGQVFVHDGDGSADIADLVRNGADQNARGREQLVQAELFAVAQIFGGIDHHGGKARSGAGAIGGEPNVGEEGFAVGPLAAALHHGPERLAVVFERGHGHQRRQVVAYGVAGQRAGGNGEKAVRGIVGQQHAAFGIGGENGRGTALDQNLELLFGVAARLHFALELGDVLRRGLAVANDLVDEQAHAEEGGEDENVAGDAGLGKPIEAVEGLRQEGACGGGGGDLPAAENASGQQHGEEIQEPEGDVALDAPVDDRDQRDHGGGAKQDGFGAAPKQG